MPTSQPTALAIHSVSPMRDSSSRRWSLASSVSCRWRHATTHNILLTAFHGLTMCSIPPIPRRASSLWRRTKKSRSVPTVPVFSHRSLRWMPLCSQCPCLANATATLLTGLRWTPSPTQCCSDGVPSQLHRLSQPPPLLKGVTSQCFKAAPCLHKRQPCRLQPSPQLAMQVCL